MKREYAIIKPIKQRSLPLIGQVSGVVWRGVYADDIINQRLDHTSSRLGGVLQHMGHRAPPIPSTQQSTYNEQLYGIFSHKMAARLSGLGWIGKCCLLVTPEVGPRVRWGTMLTDAPLKATNKPME